MGGGQQVRMWFQIKGFFSLWVYSSLFNQTGQKSFQNLYITINRVFQLNIKMNEIYNLTWRNKASLIDMTVLYLNEWKI